MEWIVRTAYTAAVLVLVVWLLREGQPLGALAVVIGALVLRRAVESGRAGRFVRRSAGLP